MTGDRSALEAALRYRFVDRDLLTRALTHRSARSEHNERLEFFGDAILGFLISELLYNRFASAAEGDLSRLRAALVREENLATTARAIDLGQYLALGPGEINSGGAQRDSTLADALEALLAAIYVDGGLDVCREVVRHLMQERMQRLDPGEHLKDPKTRLQEHLQALGLPLPEYRPVQKGDKPDRFVVECWVGEIADSALGEGSSRRRAEQEAAAKVLTTLNVG